MPNLTDKILRHALAHAAAAALVMTVALPQASAQQQEPNPVQQAFDNAISSTTLILLTSTVVVASPFSTTSTIVDNFQRAVSGGGAKKQPSSQPKRTDPQRKRRRRQQRIEHLQLMLRADGPALQQAIAAGGGEVTRDLAMMFNVPDEHHDRFVRTLRTRSTELLPLLDSHRLDAERTEDFVVRIEKAMSQDRHLALHLHELLLWEVG